MTEARGMDRLLSVVARLRGENGCPWDREQTLASLKPYLIEEAYELLEAIEDGNPDRHKEELGDLLLHILLQVQIRAEQGDFTFDDVCHSLADKLIRRHPHVFGDVRVSNSEEVLSNWETIKSQERGPDGYVMEGIPRHLPALQKAQRVQERAARVGFDWPNAQGAMDKLEEELAEMREALEEGEHEKLSQELGDLLFSLVNVCRLSGVGAEEALEQTIARFLQRFARIEARVRESGRGWHEHSLEELNRYWDAAKEENDHGRE
ncbi:MAG: nucleoside triphosphate pyrophosphohydrolase [Kiritimatiellae bacterium]|nr:nucleoside triphosphate pyrophosphohydrolase [Kiritimatiellia bacterium]